MAIDKLSTKRRAPIRKPTRGVVEHLLRTYCLIEWNTKNADAIAAGFFDLLVANKVVKLSGERVELQGDPLALETAPETAGVVLRTSIVRAIARGQLPHFLSWLVQGQVRRLLGTIGDAEYALKLEAQRLERRHKRVADLPWTPSAIERALPIERRNARIMMAVIFGLAREGKRQPFDVASIDDMRATTTRKRSDGTSERKRRGPKQTFDPDADRRLVESWLEARRTRRLTQLEHERATGHRPGSVAAAQNRMRSRKQSRA